MSILQTKNLAIGYAAPRKPDYVVAQNLNLSLQAGELVCLLGPNGAGKSTLLRTIAGMQPPLAGKIILAEDDISKLKPQELATRLSIVLTERPNVGLLNGYALVALGRHPHTDWTGRLTRYDEAVVRWAVDAVGAADLATQPVMQLSDGQRQKFMIARALAQESALMILDEPTAYLDLPRRAEIMHLLRYLAAETGRAILLSTHDLDLALRSADRLWLMADGAIHTGMPEDLVLNGTFEAAFRGQGVTFDRATGTFSVAHEHGQIIAIQGHGIPHTWTQRALKRAGYVVIDAAEVPPSTYPTIAIDEATAEPTWHLHINGDTHHHHSIHDLLAQLTAHS